MSDCPGRKPFLDKLLDFNDKRTPGIVPCPRIAKNLIDLYRLYEQVIERKGFVSVCENLEWKDIAEQLGFQITSTTAYSLRKQYGKYLLPYECKHNLNDEYDPDELFEKMDKVVKEKSKKKASSSKSSTNTPTVLASSSNTINSNSFNSVNPTSDQLQQAQPQQQFVNNYFQPQSQHSPQQKSTPNQIVFKTNHQTSNNSNQFPESAVYNQQMIFNSNNNNSKNEDQQQFINNNNSMNSSLNNQMTNECSLANYEMPNEATAPPPPTLATGNAYEMPIDPVNYNQYHGQQHQQLINQQQMMNRCFNNSNNNAQYFNQYPTDAQVNYPNSNQQGLKSNNQIQQQIYYSDTNQFNNNNYSNFNDPITPYSDIYYQDNMNVSFVAK